MPGGSSGGPAASVAAGEGFYSLGSDTGGSIRQPASLCGVVGLKPTYGLVSRYGLVAFATLLDQIGPITRDVTDCALVLNAIAGHDPMDSTSLDTDIPDYTDSLGKDLSGLRIGVPKEYFVDGMEASVEESTRRSIALLEDLGAEVEETSLPHTSYALSVYYILAPSECSANLARYDGVKYGFSDRESESMWDALEETRGQGFGPEVKRRIMLGTYALSAGYYDAFYLKAQQVRTIIRQEFESEFEKFDAICVGHVADGSVQARGKDVRPAPDVPVRRADAAREHRRNPRYVRSRGAVRRRAAHRLPDSQQAPGRADAVQDRPRLRAGLRLERPETTAGVRIPSPLMG